MPISKINSGWAWWHIPLLPALGRQGLAGLYSELQSSQSYIVRPGLREKEEWSIINYMM